MAGHVPKVANFHIFKQTEKAKCNWEVLKEPTLYILFNLAPPPLKAGLNKVYLLICDPSRCWV